MRETKANKRSFGRVLVANRGEIALRIIRTLRELEIESVAIYSESDVESLHVSEADYAIALRGETPLESYLHIDQVIRAILTSGADAVHPGYGFLAENSHFAEAVASQTGAVFIGPSVDAIRLMGDKVLARQKMLDHDVPVVPGSDGPVLSVEELRSAIKLIGYPVILKAAAGGGGRGMRVISDDTQVKSAFESCKREAKLCFGDDSLFCERFVRNPRHIEVQILFDHHGAGVHLFERDCSIQRKHQKVFEEAPSLYLSEAERQQLTTYALRAAKAVDYRGAGTVEFICESPSQVYFMEMNTRIQVEHPVTEMITGIDLIREQILIAEGKALGWTQDELKIEGWSLEVRINAEDPKNDFSPTGGRISRLRWPSGPFVRVDSHCYQGYRIPSQYDSLLAKIIVWGKTRQQAIERMKRCLRELEIEGIETTASFHEGLLTHEDFISGNFTTSFIEDKKDYFKGYYEGELSQLSMETVSSISAALRVLGDSLSGNQQQADLLESQWNAQSASDYFEGRH